MDKMEIYSAARACPPEALKQIQAGRLKGKSDINPMWRIKMLTQLFGPCGIGWYYEITKQWLEQSGDEIAAFCDISLYIKNGEEWSKPIQGTGGSSFVAREKSGLYVSDECYKMALTDALSVACKALGFAADVYWNTDRTKYDQVQQKAAPASKKAPAPAAAADDNELISDEMVKQIFAKCLEVGVSAKGICDMYKHDTLKEMTKKQYRHLVTNWTEVIRRLTA